MTAKEAWRVERERGTPDLEPALVRKLERAHRVGLALNHLAAFLAGVVLAAVLVTLAGAAFKLLAMTWRWILA